MSEPSTDVILSQPSTDVGISEPPTDTGISDPSANVNRPGLRGWSRRKKIIAAVIVAVVLALVAVLTVRLTGSATVPASEKKLATAQVTRQTLIARGTVSGTLEFGDSSQLGSRASGTVTYTASQSKTLKRNAVLWKVDQNPTLLMYGTVPAYRTLATGDSGDDVRQLEQNLQALGYGGLTVDKDYTSGTADAVTAWQNDVGLSDTGTLTLGQVVFTPGAVRVATINADRGATVQNGGAVLTVTSTERVVSIDLASNKQNLAHQGETVVVTLPDGSKANGRITTIGTVATSSSSSSGSGGAGASTTTTSSDSTIPVTVTLDDPAAARKWDSAPVDVALESERADNVFTVPVTALVALAEGGYAVQVSNGSATSLVAVKTGLFADGRVEVTGNGIAEGTVVQVPAS